MGGVDRIPSRAGWRNEHSGARQGAPGSEQDGAVGVLSRDSLCSQKLSSRLHSAGTLAIDNINVAGQITVVGMHYHTIGVTIPEKERISHKKCRASRSAHLCINIGRYDIRGSWNQGYIGRAVVCLDLQYPVRVTTH